MAKDDTTAGLMKRLVEATSTKIDWSKARTILDVSSREEAIELLAETLINARAELLKAKGAMALLVRSQSEHAIITLDMMGMVIGITNEGARLLGWPADAILGKPVDVVLANRYSAVLESSDEMERAHGGESVFTERAHVRSDGSTFKGHHALFALIGSGGHTTGFVRKIENVTAREAHEIYIEELDATIALLVD
ncbi:MAG TPA: PAS domain-containing protein [Fimbriimonadaceae bacterium]|nr:PAS domain-containing protein [Fimbriimonadaceae bacterium]